MISTEAAISQLKEGKMVILTDGSGPDKRGCFVLPAEFSTPDHINKMIFYGRGLISLVMNRKKFQELDLPVDSADQVSFDAVEVMGSGISALDRSTTIKIANSSHAQPPSHVWALEVVPLNPHPAAAFQVVPPDFVGDSCKPRTQADCDCLRQIQQYVEKR